MSFYNTGNPVPSIDPRDLDDNAKHIDEIANSTQPTYVDRLGVTRKTMAGLNAEASAAVTLRSDLAEPDGADLVGITDPSGAESTIFDEIRSIDDEYPRLAYSVSAGMNQTGPLVVKVGRTLRNTGDPADADYNNAAYQNILAGIPNGAELNHPARGMICLTGGLQVTAQGTSLVGYNGGASYDQGILKFLNPLVPAFTAKNSGLQIRNMFLWGAVPGRALNDTQDGVDFDVTLNDGHADARFENVSFLNFRYGLAANKSKVRNISAVRCVASNSRGLFSLDRVSSVGDDCRVFEFFQCKGHSVGRLGNAADSLFYINPLAQALTLIVEGGHTDDSVRIMRGFSGQSDISDHRSTRARGAFADLDATGFNQAGYEVFTLTNNKLFNIGTSSHQFSGIKSNGQSLLVIEGFVMVGAGGHGIEILSDNATISGAKLFNASMGLTDTYSGFYVAAGADNTIFSGGNAYRQNRVSSGSTTAKFGVENLGTNTAFDSRIITDGLAGAKAYYLDPTKSSHGPDPVPQGVLQRDLWGGATPPTTGTFTLADLYWNVSSSGTTILQKCVNTSPLTWQAN
jgi:hypothetical protein